MSRGNADVILGDPWVLDSPACLIVVGLLLSRWFRSLFYERAGLITYKD